MVGWIVFVALLVVVAAAGWFFLRRLTRWNDPSLDSAEKQAEAFLWSQRTGSGGIGS